MSERITDSFDLKEIERFHAGGENLKVRYQAYEKNSIEKNKASVFVMRLNINYEKNWNTFNTIGLPVVKKIYTDEKDYFVYLPDVTANGESLYGKGSYNIIENIVPHITDGGIRKNSHLDGLFLDIMTNQITYSQLRENVRHWSSVASKNNVFLPWDDPFDLIVNQKGKWELVSLDLETGGSNPNAKILSKHNLKLLSEPIEKANMLISNIFLFYVDSITKKLLSK